MIAQKITDLFPAVIEKAAAVTLLWFRWPASTLAVATRLIERRLPVVWRPLSLDVSLDFLLL